MCFFFQGSNDLSSEKYGGLDWFKGTFTYIYRKRPMNLIVNTGRKKHVNTRSNRSSLEQTKIACDRGGKSPEFELSRFLIFHPSYVAHEGFQSMRVALNTPWILDINHFQRKKWCLPGGCMSFFF